MLCLGKRGLMKRFVVMAKKIADFKIYLFLLPNKTEWALVYSPETVSIHLQLAVHTVHWNCSCRQIRYLLLEPGPDVL